MPPATVTVLMSVFNGERYLRTCIDSVLAQTYTDFEFVVIDDGSTDRSADVVRQYAAADARVRLVSRPNKGLTKTLNEGLALARGKYLARMDGDDVCLPRRLAGQVQYLDAHPDCVLVGGQVELIDPDGLLICLKDKMWLDHADIDQALMTRGWPLVHPAVTMRMDALRAVGGFNEKYVTNQDHDLFLRLAEHGRVANLPDVLLQYRQHFESVSLAKAEQQAHVVGDILAEAYARRGLPLPDNMRHSRSRQMTPVQHYTVLVLGRPGRPQHRAPPAGTPARCSARPVPKRRPARLLRPPRPLMTAHPAHPAVSVLLPVYNGGRYLRAAVDSVLAQTFTDFELLAIDDGSTDASAAVLRVVRRPTPGSASSPGPTAGWSTRSTRGSPWPAAGTWPAWTPTTCAGPTASPQQVAYLDAHPDCVLVGSRVLLVDPAGLPIRHMADERDHDAIDHAHLNCGWPVVHPAVMMRTGRGPRVGGSYRDQYNTLEDTDLFLRLAEVGRLANLPEVLLDYRQHFGSVTHTRAAKQHELRQGLYDETRARRGLPPADRLSPPPQPRPRSEQHRAWAWSALKNGHVRTARKHAAATVRHGPRWPAARGGRWPVRPEGALTMTRCCTSAPASPWDGGAGFLVRQNVFLRALADVADELHLAMFDGDTAAPPPFARSLTPLPRPARRRPGRARQLLGRPDLAPAPHVRGFDLTATRAAVAALKPDSFDAVFAYRIDFAHYAGVLTHRRLILDVDDPEHVRAARRAATTAAGPTAGPSATWTSSRRSSTPPRAAPSWPSSASRTTPSAGPSGPRWCRTRSTCRRRPGGRSTSRSCCSSATAAGRR